jgi:hypothetical protein
MEHRRNMGKSVWENMEHSSKLQRGSEVTEDSALFRAAGGCHVLVVSFVTSTLKMETVCFFFETLEPTYETTRRQNPRHHQEHTNRLENLKSYYSTCSLVS